MRPAIFFPLKTFPGSWHWPVDPSARWLREVPWLAGIPRKPCRFIAPWKPFPLEMPETSTFCPGTKCLAWMVEFSGSRFSSSDTRNSLTRYGGESASSGASLYCPRTGPDTFLALRSPAATRMALYPCFSTVLWPSTMFRSSQRTVVAWRTPQTSSQTGIIPTLMARAPQRLSRSVQMGLSTNFSGMSSLRNSSSLWVLMRGRFRSPGFQFG
mmetsp:Transcript_32353/g.76105  ORF Transcript_32353/g.76105 Transcript_32353/m.76105 type:complete len:212 (-) Transcript_32353:241-876(-)